MKPSKTSSHRKNDSRRKERSQKAWTLDTQIACRKELQDLGDMLAKFTAIRNALQAEKQSWDASRQRAISQAWETTLLRKEFRLKLLDEQVCGAAIPTAYANSNALSPPVPGNACSRRERWNMHMPCVVWLHCVFRWRPYCRLHSKTLKHGAVRARSLASMDYAYMTLYVGPGYVPGDAGDMFRQHHSL